MKLVNYLLFASVQQTTARVSWFFCWPCSIAAVRVRRSDFFGVVVLSCFRANLGACVAKAPILQINFFLFYADIVGASESRPIRYFLPLTERGDKTAQHVTTRNTAAPTAPSLVHLALSFTHHPFTFPP